MKTSDSTFNFNKFEPASASHLTAFTNTCDSEASSASINDFSGKIPDLTKYLNKSPLASFTSEQNLVSTSKLRQQVVCQPKNANKTDIQNLDHQKRFPRVLFSGSKLVISPRTCPVVVLKNNIYDKKPNSKHSICSSTDDERGASARPSFEKNTFLNEAPVNATFKPSTDLDHQEKFLEEVKQDSSNNTPPKRIVNFTSRMDVVRKSIFR